MKHLLLISSVFFLVLASCGSEKNKSPYVIALGIAQDGGVPQAGCTKVCCKNRWMKSKKEIYVTSLGIVDPNSMEAWIIEASPDFPFQHKKLSADNEVKGLFITHAHIGHYAGLMYFGREALGSQGIKVNVLPRMFDFISTNAPWSQLVDLMNITLSKINFGDNIVINPTLSVIPIQVPHRDEFSETSAFLIVGPNKTALFLPDIDKWSKWSINIVEMLLNVDYAFIDATFYTDNEINRDINEIPHPLVIETMDLLSDLPDYQKDKVYFIHMNHTNQMLDANSDTSRNVLEKGFNIARLGQKFHL